MIADTFAHGYSAWATLPPRENVQVNWSSLNPLPKPLGCDRAAAGIRPGHTGGER